ncbi:MAG: adenylosuccinate lyase [Planctomycetota bacterium]
MSSELYENPLITRYASRDMARIWSAQNRHSIWRTLWIALADCQRELGLAISTDQIQQMQATREQIDFAAADRYERQLRHDVMAHVYSWGDQIPAARPIIHLGATSCFVTDNSELILMRDSLQLLRKRLVQVIDQLARFASTWRSLPCLGFTHLQPAQPTTVGKRAALWCWDLLLDLEELEHRLQTLRFRGVKGTTGTQASFLTLFHGDHAKVEELDRMVTARMGFSSSHAVTGQTYSRKSDSQVMSALNGLAQSCHKAGSDIRILQHRKEIEEPFEKSQIGSSAMAYKRNPMRSERMCSLARFVISQQSGVDATMATQWLERSLDDSAIRRLALPQAFLATDACLILYRNITDGMVVYPKVIAAHLQAELPFMATEEILMAGVQAGGDRQELHEVIRSHSQAAAEQVKREGRPNDLLERLQSDNAFRAVNLSGTLDAARFVGRAPEQVDALIAEYIEPLRKKHPELLAETAEAVRV